MGCCRPEILQTDQDGSEPKFEIRTVLMCGICAQPQCLDLVREEQVRRFRLIFVGVASDQRRDKTRQCVEGRSALIQVFKRL